MPTVTMERIATFAAAHRLNSDKLTAEQNKETFGKCNNANGHGHNYVWKVNLGLATNTVSHAFQVKLRGEVDPVSGMVYDLAKLKNEMNLVLDTVDHKNLDKDVEFFKVSSMRRTCIPDKFSMFQTTVSTSENVAIYMFDKLKSVMSNPGVLYKVTIHETDKNIFTYKGQ